MRLITPFSLMLIAAAAVPCGAGSAGGEPLGFLLMDTDARAAGVGGAFTSLAEGAAAPHYNPAGLGFSKRYETSLTHNRFLEGASHEYASLVHPGGYGVYVNYLGYGKIYRTTISNPDKTLGRVGSSDLALGIARGVAVREGLSLGVGFKFVRETLDTLTAEAYAVDLGATLKPPSLPDLSLGVAVRNIGRYVEFQKAREELPLEARAGASYRLKPLRTPAVVSLDLRKARTAPVSVHVGAEVLIAGIMLVRAGFTNQNESGLGLMGGLGWRHRDFAIDYAVVPFGGLGVAHQFSLGARWGGEGESAARAPKRSFEEVSWTLEEKLELAKKYKDTDQEILSREEFEELLSRIPDEDPRRITIYERLGLAHYRRHEMPKAQDYYLRAVSLAALLGRRGPEVAGAYLGMGRCLIWQDDKPSAAQYLEKGLRAGPTDSIRKQIKKELEGLSVN